MPTTFGMVYDASWTTDSNINNSTIANSGTATTANISNDGKTVTLVSVVVTYAASSVGSGVQVYVVSDIDGGTTYEATTDNVFGFMLPYNYSTTYHKEFPVYATDVRDFKVILSNGSGNSVTGCYVRYRQGVLTQS